MKDLTQLRVVIREDLNHFTPIGAEWYRGFKELGVQVELVNSSAALVNTSAEVDLFINHCSISSVEELNYIKRVRTVNSQAVTMSTVTRPLESLIPFFSFVDIWFDNGYDHPEQREWFTRHSQQFISVMEASSKGSFFKLEDVNKVNDLSFIGQFGDRGHGYRGQDRFLYPLLDNQQLKSALYGVSYKHITAQYIQHSDVNLVFNQTKVNLNFHYPEQKLSKVVMNKRTFDICASGNFQLVDHPLYEQLIGEKSYSNPEEYVEAFYYYLNNPEERERVALRAQQKVLQEHTWKVRMNELIKKVYSYDNL
jgi:hypothetical protein